MKGLTFILEEPLSEEAEEKLRKMSERSKKRQEEILKKMREDYEAGKLDNIINKL